MLVQGEDWESVFCHENGFSSVHFSKISRGCMLPPPPPRSNRLKPLWTQNHLLCVNLRLVKKPESFFFSCEVYKIYMAVNCPFLTAYPTVRTIQTTQQVGNMQRLVNTAQPHHVIGTTPQQVIQHQQRIVGNTRQVPVVHGTQPATTRVAQPHVIQMTQLQAGDNKVSVVPCTLFSCK